MGKWAGLSPGRPVRSRRGRWGGGGGGPRETAMGMETCGWLWVGFGSWNQEIIIMGDWMFLFGHQEEAEGSPVWN